MSNYELDRAQRRVQILEHRERMIHRITGGAIDQKISIVYVFGPYSANSPMPIDVNIKRAEGVAIKAIAKGWFALTPHLNTAQFDRHCPDVPIDFWYQGDLRLMAMCDALVGVEGWERSTGSMKERKFAQRLGIPVYESIDELPDLGE